MTRDQHDQPELIPYASHVAHGTGRTPIGIILFAASHLMLGGAVAFVVLTIMRLFPPVAAHQVFFRVVMIGGAVTAVSGGVALLLKGRAAWMLSVGSFAALALFEAALAGMAMAWSTKHRMLQTGVGMIGVTVALFAMCVVVLRYLASAKARDTFALPPGETSRLVRWLPLVVIGIFLGALAAAPRFGYLM